ncbi:hypothetical protein A4D02_32215 [Niastella koreensis]|uniref:Methyltransferase type 11 n=2 Tax=Niastella koreensis TaxID=354356 RepID=G8TBX4_NIAKG|nr:SAM-dependent methyltransferase [Niastella koreensis]AEV99267.1 hypothetical protein Niako_2936 [Niastella koreensis GR20-10]OQP46056.1 hypothetical protein A4D02_32215 [Niastella koreensis]
MSKVNYLVRSILNFPSPKKCPYCNSQKVKSVDRKYVVTTLNECVNCELLFRHPTDSVSFNAKFYQKAYKQSDSITTDLPSKEQLESWKSNNFKDSIKDYSDKIDILTWLTNGPSKILDYGANWGYTSFQLKTAGFNVQSYEISQPRAEFGKELGLQILTDEKNITPGIDLFFSAHVIEHLPDIKQMFLLAQKLLTADGYFVAYCPNGSNAFKQANPFVFHKFWGQVHPNFLSGEFYSKAFKDVPYLIGSNASPAEAIKNWDKKSQTVLDLTGDELFVIAKIKNQRF